MRIVSRLALLSIAGFALSCWAQQARPQSERKTEQSQETSKPKPQAPQRWYSDCPGCATTLGKGGRAGPFSTAEECQEKVAKLVANGYPYGLCRLEQ